MIPREGRLYYLGEEVGKEDENNRKTQDGEVPKEDEWVEEDNEDSRTRDGEFKVINFVVRWAMISEALDDPSQMENLFHTKCLIEKYVLICH